MRSAGVSCPSFVSFNFLMIVSQEVCFEVVTVQFFSVLSF